MADVEHARQIAQAVLARIRQTIRDRAVDPAVRDHLRDEYLEDVAGIVGALGGDAGTAQR